MIYVQFGKFLTQDDSRSTQSAFRLRPLVISGGSRIFQRETPVFLSKAHQLNIILCVCDM